LSDEIVPRETAAPGVPPLETRFLIQTGADLVHLTEALSVRFFMLSQALLLSFSALMLPLSYADPRSDVGAISYLLAITAGAAAVIALARPSPVYRWLRATTLHQMALPAVGVAAVLLDAPYSPSWWIAQGLLFVIATVGSASQILVGSVMAATAFAAGIWMHGQSLLPDADTGYLAQTAALLIDPLVARFVVETFSRFVLRLHRLEVEVAEGPPLVRVAAIQFGEQPAPDLAAERLREPKPAVGKLTSRQMEVALLLRDGLHQNEIAACLGISTRQLERLCNEARKRSGAATTSELIAMLVAAHLAPQTGSGGGIDTESEAPG
jgi:DNA-binding CsgD family transcriptional regulator